MSKHLLIALLVSWGGLLLLSFTASAQSQTTLSLAPAITEIALQPAQSAQATLRLTNQTDDQLVISTSSQSLIPDDMVIDSSKRTQYDAAEWISLVQGDYILDPFETREVKVDIVVPDNAGPGGHYATIRFKPVTPPAADQQIKVESEVAALLFINVAGDIQENIEFLNIDTPAYATRGLLPISFRLANIGNTHSLVKNTLTIKKGDSVVYEEDIKPQIVLPNTIRTFESGWEAAGFGSYSVQVVTQFGSDNSVVSSSGATVFIGPPLLPLAIGSVVVIVLVSIIVTKRTLSSKHRPKTTT